MQVTSVGHAGFRIDTKAGSILCDPWVNPAYFASWFPFPDNSALDWDALGDCDYLYVSHLHRDHFDPKNLREHVNKDAVVLLPDYPVPDLQRELREAGLSPVLRDHRLGQAPRQRAQGRSRRDDHRAARPGRRSDRRLRPGGRRRRDRVLQHERRAARRPGRAARRLRPDRRAHAAVLGRDLVPDGLRHAGPRQEGVRHAEASAPDGPLPPVHRAGRRDLGGAVGRPAVLPRSGAARPQRRPRRPGQHLPRPGGVPRPDADARPRRRPADDPRVDGGFHWLTS